MSTEMMSKVEDSDNYDDDGDEKATTTRIMISTTTMIKIAIYLTI